METTEKSKGAASRGPKLSARDGEGAISAQFLLSFFCSRKTKSFLHCAGEIYSDLIYLRRRTRIFFSQHVAGGGGGGDDNTTTVKKRKKSSLDEGKETKDGKEEVERRKEMRVIEGKALELFYNKFMDLPDIFLNPSVNTNNEKKKEVLQTLWTDEDWVNEENKNKYRREARKKLGLKEIVDDFGLKCLKCCNFADGTCIKITEGKKEEITYKSWELQQKFPVGSEKAGQICCYMCHAALKARGKLCALAGTGLCYKANMAKQNDENLAYTRLETKVPDWHEKAGEYCCPTCRNMLVQRCVFSYDKNYGCNTPFKYTPFKFAKNENGAYRKKRYRKPHEHTVPATASKYAGAPCCDACYERHFFKK